MEDDKKSFNVILESFSLFLGFQRSIIYEITHIKQYPSLEFIDPQMDQNP